MSDSNDKKIEVFTDRIISEYNNKILLIYANNGVGKTRTSYSLRKKFNSDEVLCFSAFFEEYFIWNYDLESDNYYLNINDNDSIIHKAIVEDGLDSQINKSFMYLTGKKINADFLISNNKIDCISFSLKTGDDSQLNNIKISKGEETLFIWSVFYSITNQRLSDIIEGNDDKLKYIIIDDPVASLVEENIISIAVQIRKEIKSKIREIHEMNRNIGLFISTHNKILWNILYNEFKINKNQCKRLVFENGEYLLLDQKDSPFGYHLELIKKIKSDLFDRSITKEDFHRFRVILEKMQNFYGFDKFEYFLNDSLTHKEEFIRLLDYYSHDSNDELEEKLVDDSKQILLKNFFEQFIEDYKMVV